MLFTIHADGAVPIYEQIVAQVIYGVADGTLETGGLIPSVRELAETLLVHPNTVAPRLPGTRTCRHRHRPPRRRHGSHRRRRNLLSS